MPRSVYDTMLVTLVGLLVGSVIWTVSAVAYDDPAAGWSMSNPVCPEEGIRVTAGPVNPALGLRAMDLTLVNCGTRAYRVQGYPEIRLYDQDQQRLTGVTVVHGSGGIATVTGFDDPPGPVTLAPGETASAGLLWRNTTTGLDGPTSVPYLTVAARSGSLQLLLKPDGGLDLGTTGRLGVGPWRTTGGTR
ncbi:DUF4232 domain-containing protein [Streptomyces sp. MBT62]|uniref:DUF4232 domain-containing protein n=1 Tax=Streptomyces sp. MBT62 TaxID=2800410 RepID=UPI001909D737|nr:DUF4232 domain-containing protein [Streptomyces sp. MBT62]MBK3563930.1 DUF4232 domain-containing protein [Streptomyces sp. MBT62]